MGGWFPAGFMRGFCAVAYRGEGQPQVSAYNLSGALRELMSLYPVPGLDPEQVGGTGSTGRISRTLWCLVT